MTLHVEYIHHGPQDRDETRTGEFVRDVTDYPNLIVLRAPDGHEVVVHRANVVRTEGR